MSQAPPLTLQQRLGPGAVLRRGRKADYRQLAVTDGEAYTVRSELGPAADDALLGRARVLMTLAHVTDLQLADVMSPARFEFFNREVEDPRFAKLVPVQRPQEALTGRAVGAMVRTLNRITGAPLSGAPLELVLTTGDAIDNAQWNELQMVLALLEGGLVVPSSGRGVYEGVQHGDWPDDVFWRPEPGHRPDLFRDSFGFGEHPGLLAAALTAFHSDGLALPWLACYGNHEGLIQGVGKVTPAIAAAMVGDRKPVRMPEDFDRDAALDAFIASCEVFLDGETITVAPDPARRPLSRREFVEAHFTARARPFGHGFGDRNRRDGTCYYAHDLANVRLIGLDTTCLDGSSDGCLDHDQFLWLQDELAEVHSSYLTPDGSTVTTGNDDRLVVLFSHHGLATLTNVRGAVDEAGEPAFGAAQIEKLLHRFPNVVLWVTGHTHTNAVRPRPSPVRPGAGFWEVTTCAVMDWPSQARLLELLDTGDGLLRIVCTMLDHDAPVVPDLATLGGAGAGVHGNLGALASLHRELAGNVPSMGFGTVLEGTVTDRNVVLSLPAPFPLRDLG